MNQNIMSESAFHSYIKSVLRRASMRWPPLNSVRAKARKSRGMYLCAGCGELVPASILQNGKRVKNVLVDHINPIVPITGFDNWDNVIQRLFCDESNLQVLCKNCHDKKTKQERDERKNSRS